MWTLTAALAATVLAATPTTSPGPNLVPMLSAAVLDQPLTLTLADAPALAGIECARPAE